MNSTYAGYLDMTVKPLGGVSHSSSADQRRAARVRGTRYAGEQQIIQDMLQASPGMSLNTAAGFADTSISVYCADGYINNS